MLAAHPNESQTLLVEVIGAGERIQDLELGGSEHQPAVLVLAVEREQPRAERLEVCGVRRTALDEGAGPTAGANAASNDDLLRSIRQPLRELAQLGVVEHPRRNRERALDVCLRGARPDDLRPRPPAQQEVQRVGEDRLPRARLAGDRIEARLEAELGPLDQQQVLDSQLVQHAH